MRMMLLLAFLAFLADCPMSAAVDMNSSDYWKPVTEEQLRLAGEQLNGFDYKLVKQGGLARQEDGFLVIRTKAGKALFLFCVPEPKREVDKP